MKKYINKNCVDLVINCSAMTDTTICEEEPDGCYMINSLPNLVLCYLTAKLVYISTDHVFDGKKGLYTEECFVNPQGVYAKSKVMGEWFTSSKPNNLIIRTSFMENFKLDQAFTDKFGSWLWVEDCAAQISKAVKLNLSGLYHIGGVRKSVYDFVSERYDVKPTTLSKNPISRCGLPYLVDTSLYIKKWQDANRPN